MWHLSRQIISRQLIGRKFFDPDYLTLEKNWSCSDSRTRDLCRPRSFRYHSIDKVTKSGDGWITESKKRMISQSIDKGNLIGIFVHLPIYNRHPTLVKAGSWEEVRKFIQVQHKNETQQKRWFAHSLQGDSDTDNIYATMNFANELWNSGIEQIITSVEDYSETDFILNNFKITSCTSVCGKYQLVLTKGAPGFSGDQRVTIFSNWADFQTPDGEILTGICYNKYKQEYMVVLTEDPVEPCYCWFDSWDIMAMNDWENDQLAQSRVPTLIFCDPNVRRVLIVASVPTVVQNSNADIQCYSLA